MSLSISSLQNSRIKDVIRLAKRGERDRRRLMVVEGEREILAGLNHGHHPVEAFVCTELLTSPDAWQVFDRMKELASTTDLTLCLVTPPVFKKLAYRGASGGILAIFPFLETDLQRFSASGLSYVLVVEGAEKPGNLGAILRTADAAGVECVIVCDGGTDVHNPNVARASLGAIFTVPIAEASSRATIDWLCAHGLQILAAGPEGAELYTTVDMRRPTAIVTGSESAGLPPIWMEAAAHQITIPMHGYVDSLNLSTSTAILLYEVVRQRADTANLPPLP